ncbi:hypothetical protein [Bradyrhizobium sp. BR 1432]|uniref:hypothetical protein n=1 Tax=Bradyrhizobium sp. BR 1432 TaxID=3447966 RepID=UPI003EE552FC
MAGDSMVSHNNAPLKNGESIRAEVRKIFLSKLTVAIVSCGCGVGCLVQDVVCFKRDNSTACNYVLRENRHRFFIKRSTGIGMPVA